MLTLTDGSTEGQPQGSDLTHIRIRHRKQQIKSSSRIIFPVLDIMSRKALKEHSSYT